MIHLLECCALSAVAVSGLAVWSCLLLAGWADARLDELGFNAERDIFRRNFFEAEPD